MPSACMHAFCVSASGPSDVKTGTSLFKRLEALEVDYPEADVDGDEYAGGAQMRALVAVMPPLCCHYYRHLDLLQRHPSPLLLLLALIWVRFRVFGVLIWPPSSPASPDSDGLLFSNIRIYSVRDPE